MTLSQESSGAAEKVVSLSHPTDSIVYNYRIDKLLAPYIGGKEINWMSNNYLARGLLVSQSYIL